MIYLLIYLGLVLAGVFSGVNDHGKLMRVHAGWRLLGVLIALSLLTAGGAFQPIFSALAG